MSTVVNDDDNEFHNYKLTNLDIITKNSNPILDAEVSTNKCDGNKIDKNTIP